MRCKCCIVKTKQKQNKENVLLLLAGMQPNARERESRVESGFLYFQERLNQVLPIHSDDGTFKDIGKTITGQPHQHQTGTVTMYFFTINDTVGFFSVRHNVLLDVRNALYKYNCLALPSRPSYSTSLVVVDRVLIFIFILFFDLLMQYVS